VRRIAVETLEKIRVPTALPALLHCLHDENPWVRWAAITAVAWSDDPEVAAAVTPLIDDPDPVVRRRACEMFANVLRPIPVNTLAARLDDEDVWVRFWCVEALRATGYRSVIPSLVYCLEDPEEMIRTRAVRALSYLGGEEIVPILVNLIQHNAQMITLASEALKRIESPLARSILEHIEHYGPEAELDPPAPPPARPYQRSPRDPLSDKTKKRSIVNRLIGYFKRG
jgi:HEAT repeat protein